ncbi:uncharacterized protein VICG_00795 [Vittaforma corneae ATCC 50505]|uniref:Uncharacterized protein n=1 Tax=Vittaforma corneae (strain ATCC 50505) TaxID=993615 RepID=L2GPC6_VITCO|nr:uncharacterized protein VICG_00795 [Vittaforma corneae ATCC 50505]ELA42152.1 hypothetical protein VICG_00795 [Vittaforma corneae ATCC 50505]
MFINPNYTTRTVSDQSLAVDQSTKNEFNTSFSTISTIMDNRTQPTFVAMALEQLDIENVNIEERLLSNIDTIIIVGKYFRIFMIAVAVIQLISTIIMCKRRKPTLIAPIGSYHTKCATTLASIFNLVMILLDGVVIFCCWKKDYSLHDYSFLLHSGANYCIILFITVLLTMMGYCRGYFFLHVEPLYPIYSSIYYRRCHVWNFYMVCQ